MTAAFASPSSASGGGHAPLALEFWTQKSGRLLKRPKASSRRLKADGCFTFPVCLLFWRRRSFNLRSWKMEKAVFDRIDLNNPSL
jgi:hypothetical protein